MEKIDIGYDYRKDTLCRDPDNDSHKLYETHKILWEKSLPCGKKLEINIINDKYGRLLLKNNQYLNLSSDRMCPHFDGKYKGRFNGWLSDKEIEDLKYKVRTIGGHIVFPAHKKNGFTINQARGVKRNISDRFDLTLECIRRFYRNENSPLFDTLMRYSDFFDLFLDFNGYIDFFILQDFIDKKGKIRFALSFDDFERSPLPQTIEEYKLYKDNTIELIDNRNNRILKSFD
jgi:hypothetical protein